MKEWTRTVILLGLIGLAVVYIIWSHHTATANLLQGA